MIWIALAVGLGICALLGVLLLFAGAALMDEPLSDEWRRAHVGDHGDGEEY